MNNIQKFFMYLTRYLESMFEGEMPCFGPFIHGSQNNYGVGDCMSE